MLPSRRPMGAPGGPAEVGTLADVMDFSLWLCCPACLREVHLSPTLAAIAHGAQLELRELRRRARCKGCGAKGANLYVAERRR
jgi:hypothetical protein